MAPQTRLSARRQSDSTAAKPAKPAKPEKPAQTKPTATATATTPATPRRRGRPPKEQSTLSNNATGAVKKAAKRAKPPGSRRNKKLPIKSLGKSINSQKNRRQEESAVPQNEDARPPRKPKPGPKSNRKLPAQPNKQQTGAGVQQNPSRRRSQRTNDLAEVSTRPRQEEPDETALRYTLSNPSLQRWLRAPEVIPAAEGNMAQSSKTRKRTMHDEVVAQNAKASRNGGTDRRGGTARTNGTSSTVKPQQDIYKDKSYREILGIGVDGVRLIMDSDDDDDTEMGHHLTQESEHLLQKLMQMRTEDQPDPRFHPLAVKSLLKRMHNHKEHGISHELHAIVCPPAGIFRDLSFKNRTLRQWYDELVHQWDEPWVNQPLLLPRFKVPRPDYCVGFSLRAFLGDRSNKLSMLASGRTTFMPTSLMYFPFLTCEVKAPNEGIEPAENQNGYSMLVTVRAMVELFRAAKLEHSCSGHVMAFSISYNHEWAYIFAYFPIVDGEKTIIYRRRVYKYLLSPDDTEDTAQAWDFVRNVYEEWAPRHLARLREAVDTIDFSTPIPVTDSEAMSMDTDRGVNFSGNPNRRGAPEQPAQQRSPKRTRM